MKKVKLIIMILILLLLVGCKDDKPSSDIETLEDKLYKLETVNLNDNKLETKQTQFYVISIIETVNPAITYTSNNVNEITDSAQSIVPSINGTDNYDGGGEETSPNEIAKINISRELDLQVKYNSSVGETPERVELKYVKILQRPKIGKTKIYAINSGDFSNYISLMRNNEITSNSILYKNDLDGKELKDGVQNIRFSITIDEIIKSSIPELMEKDYLNILKDNNVKNEDLSYHIEFAILIYTNKNVYALKAKFTSLSIDIYNNQIQKIYYNKNPIYFEKLK